QTANCFNKSKGVFITDPKLKALLNPQPSWGFSGHKKGVLFYQYPSIRFIAIQLKLMLPAQSLKTFPYGYTNQQSIAMLYTIPALILRLS
ncbi:hypothetical protein, partial [Yersinia pestis]